MHNVEAVCGGTVGPIIIVLVNTMVGTGNVVVNLLK
jgi:hypothetical protein